MASKPVLLTAFFDQFSSFLTELHEMYPADTDFPMFVTGLRVFKSTNPSMLIRYIHDYTKPYEEVILKKDEKFFIENSFSEYTGQVSDMNIFKKLKEYYVGMNSDSKESVWKYCQNIIRLSGAYLA
jgi:hypothetical protein